MQHQTNVVVELETSGLLAGERQLTMQRNFKSLIFGGSLPFCAIVAVRL